MEPTLEKVASEGVADKKIEPKKLDERRLKAFNAVVSFVGDLSEVFGDTKVVTPLSLYNRLVVKHINFTEIGRIDEALRGFTAFFDNYGDAVVKKEWDKIPRGTLISYGSSDKIGLEIQKYLYKADDSTKGVIRQHLLTIQAILKPADTQFLLQELEKVPQGINPLNPPADLKAAMKIDESTNEGKFISGIMTKTKEAMADMDASNPTAAIMNLAQSGIIQDLIGGIQNGVAGGQMDMHKLLGTMSGALQALMPPPPSSQTKSSVEEVKDAVLKP